MRPRLRHCRCALDRSADLGLALGPPQRPALPWQRAHKLFLDRAVLALKQQAIAAHTSQLQADEQTPPVLDREALARLQQPFELVFT